MLPLERVRIEHDWGQHKLEVEYGTKLNPPPPPPTQNPTPGAQVGGRYWKKYHEPHDIMFHCISALISILHTEACPGSGLLLMQYTVEYTHSLRSRARHARRAL